MWYESKVKLKIVKFIMHWHELTHAYNPFSPGQIVRKKTKTILIQMKIDAIYSAERNLLCIAIRWDSEPSDPISTHFFVLRSCNKRAQEVQQTRKNL